MRRRDWAQLENDLADALDRAREAEDARDAFEREAKASLGRLREKHVKALAELEDVKAELADVRAAGYADFG